ncbi:hypothetical protein BP6252_04660 [Coleophoma cylindrospora]|uniref:DNA endonuclease activator Ctp1 C-terminal domain-containing protein n=1 Tax=Coleophoma cylindrospora TaxID=1849047 RepID=A0A3D8S134_9HELO|nr:hypothetical protein BP6252_04660 [Coleophoma cylindrospora]
MDQWRNERASRKERFDDFFAEYEAELAVGLKGKLLEADELQKLRSAVAEVERLKEQNIQLGNSLREQQRLREEATQATKIAEDNARLQSENQRLKESRDQLSEELRDRLTVATEKVDLEEEVHRLTEELKESRQKLQEVRQNIQGQQVRKKLSTPDTDAYTSPVTSASSNTEKPISAREHDKLVARYNKLCKNHKETEEARKVLEDTLRRRKSERRDWDRLGKEQKLEIEQKADRISRLEEEIQELRAQVEELEKHPGALRSASPLNVCEGNVADLPQPAVQYPTGSAHSRPPHTSGNDVATGETVTMAERESTPNGRGRGQMTVESNPLDDATRSELSMSSTYPSIPVPGTTRPFQATRNTSLAEKTDSDITSTPLVRLETKPYTNSEDETQGSSPRRASDKEQSFHSDGEILTLKSSESPEVLEVRRVSKRKRKTDATETSSRTKIKTEPTSSSPIGIVGMISYHDSMDLDEIGERIRTPTKKRHFEVLNQATDIWNDESRDEFEEACADRTAKPLLKTPAQPKTSALQPLSPNRRILPSTSNGKTSRRRIASNNEIGSLAEDGGISQELIPAKVPSPLRQSELAARLENLLEGTSPAKHVLTRPRAAVSSEQKKSPRKSTFFISRDAIMASENVTFPTQETPVPSSRLSRPSVNWLTPGSNLLSPNEAAYISQTTPSGASKGRMKTYTLKAKTPIGPQNQPQLITASLSTEDLQEAREKSSFTRDSVNRKAHRRNTVAKHQDSEMMDAENPDNEPFRSRPLHRLGLEHFKVNPAYNGGYDYAFTDVVRGKEDRACLQGCVKPDCCGSKFRTLAETLYREPLTAQEKEEESRLLDDFLGDNRSKLRNMTPEGRKDLVIQAKIRELSNKYGKHRQQFHRSSSIPGLWDTDFPNTQEDEELRQKQHERERELVEQRHMEAMRPGGAYLFKDE